MIKNRFEMFDISVIELNRYLQRIKESEMKKFSLKARHTMCLYYLGKYEEGLTAAQLTKLCREDKAAISRSLAQLIDKEFVVCEETEGKRSYRTLHFLTERGRRVMDEIDEKIERALSYGGNGLSEEQRNCFYQSMKIISENLCHYAEKCEENV